MIKIAKYGLDNFFVGIAFGLLLILLPVIFSFIFLFQILLWILGAFFILFAFWFFRDPKRSVPLLAVEDGSIILAPADGKVVEIKEFDESKLLKQRVIQISIFLSPLDVHVNRSPATGRVFYVEYFPGKYLVAYHPKASEENEHTFVGLENEFGRIAFKQIAGILARRIVCTLKVGDNVDAGEKIGMMKFGSRMDVFVPIGARIFVQIGQKVRGGETIIARLHKEYNFPNI